MRQGNYSLHGEAVLNPETSVYLPRCQDGQKIALHLEAGCLLVETVDTGSVWPKHPCRSVRAMMSYARDRVAKEQRPEVVR